MKYMKKTLILHKSFELVLIVVIFWWWRWLYLGHKGSCFGTGPRLRCTCGFAADSPVLRVALSLEDWTCMTDMTATHLITVSNHGIGFFSDLKGLTVSLLPSDRTFRGHRLGLPKYHANQQLTNVDKVCSFAKHANNWWWKVGHCMPLQYLQHLDVVRMLPMLVMSKYVQI